MSGRFVILSSKPGQFRTELSPDLEAIEAYDYLLGGRKRAHFVIARLLREVKVRIVEESPPSVVNLVPSKFLPRFDTLEKARAELKSLVSFRSLKVELVPGRPE